MIRTCIGTIMVMCFVTAGGAQDQAGKALNSPDCIKVPEARAERPDDEQLGVGRNGEFCAYPVRMMAYHRIVNDHLGGPPILVAYDPESGSGQVYDPVLDKRELQFDFADYENGAPILKDRQTGSRWSQITGEAIDGPLKGKRLARIPCWIITWQRWRELHADSYVLKEDPAQSPQYVTRTTPAVCPIPMAVKQSLHGRADKRLPQDAMVLGVSGARGANVYPMTALARTKGVLPDKVATEPIVIFYDAAGKASGAYSPWIELALASFTPQDTGGARLFKDSITGTLWNIEGAAVSGPLKGKSLAAIPFARCRWYAWSAAFPGSRIALR